MHDTKRLQSVQKRDRVHATLTAMIATGQELTKSEVARRACVSRSFLGRPDLAAEFDLALAQIKQRFLTGATAHGQLTVASLKAEMEISRYEAAGLRKENHALKQRLGLALGAEIAATAAPEHRPDHELLDELQTDLAERDGRLAALRETLREREEELDAARQLNRRLMRQHNTPALRDVPTS